jgi:hypothetical protein
VPGFFGAYGKKTEPGRLAGWANWIRTAVMLLIWLERRGVPGFFGTCGRRRSQGDWLAESRIRTLTMAAEFALLLRDRFACHFIGVKPN